MKNLFCTLAIALMTLACATSCSKEEKKPFNDSEALKAAERITVDGKATDADITLYENGSVEITDKVSEAVEKASSLENVDSVVAKIKDNHPGYANLSTALSKANLTDEQKGRINGIQKDAINKLSKVAQKKAPQLKK